MHCNSYRQQLKEPLFLLLLEFFCICQYFQEIKKLGEDAADSVHLWVSLKKIGLYVKTLHLNLLMPALTLPVLFCVCVHSAGLLDNEDIRVMMQGSSMVKVRSSRWQKKRNLQLLEDGLTLWCESTKRSRKAKAQQTCKLGWNPAIERRRELVVRKG